MIDTQVVLIALCIVEAVAIAGLLFLNSELRYQVRVVEELLSDTGAMPLHSPHLAERAANDHRP